MPDEMLGQTRIEGSVGCCTCNLPVPFSPETITMCRAYMGSVRRSGRCLQACHTPRQRREMLHVTRCGSPVPSISTTTGSASTYSFLLAACEALTLLELQTRMHDAMLAVACQGLGNCMKSYTCTVYQQRSSRIPSDCAGRKCEKEEGGRGRGRSGCPTREQVSEDMGHCALPLSSLTPILAHHDIVRVPYKMYIMEHYRVCTGAA